MQSPTETMGSNLLNKGDAMPNLSRSSIARDGGPSSSLLDTIIECLDDAKSENIVTIDLEGKNHHS